MNRLLELMRILRSRQGWPWDREQTLESLKPFLLEESYEALDAVDSGDRARLADELGDVLLQVVFQSQLCAEEGTFRFNDVVRGLCNKLIRRHPHVFGNLRVSGSREVLKNWEKIKRTEKGAAQASVIDGIPRHLPALHKAHQVQKRVARVGFDWEEAGQVVEKLDEEVREMKEALRGGDAVRVKEELGDLLFTVVNLSRFLGYSAEEALNTTINKFTRRFRSVENRLRRQGRKVSDCPIDELEILWRRVKAAERRKPRKSRRRKKSRVSNAGA